MTFENMNTQQIFLARIMMADRYKIWKLKTKPAFKLTLEFDNDPKLARMVSEYSCTWEEFETYDPEAFNLLKQRGVIPDNILREFEK